MVKRRSRTRNQMRRETIKTVFLSVILIILWAVLTVYAIGVWAEHPGEQPVGRADHMASIQYDWE